MDDVGDSGGLGRSRIWSPAARRGLRRLTLQQLRALARSHKELPARQPLAMVTRGKQQNPKQ